MPPASDRPSPQFAFSLETGLRWGELTGLRWCNVDLVRRVIHVREVLTEVRGRIKRKIYPKSDAGLRTVPITGLALRVLRELLADEPDARVNRSEPDAGLCPAELVFHGRNKIRRGTKKDGSDGEPYRAPLRRSAFRRLWTKALQDSGVGRTKTKKVTVEETDPGTGRTRKVQKERTEHWPAFHDQRHSFASDCTIAACRRSSRRRSSGTSARARAPGSTPTPWPTTRARS
ncbi:tyrosine-type recombinase/integrase [Streptomyces sp. NBC_01358]|uniref:tyrosine-type recombinase/integrase n=1 Tax=Streptomyces sp. NBC_01358 TaxID=2903837 RepID=UPI002E3096DA|nr:tyrosine-type recombinase/integrase [Streptomyces sp. NBC_01358]